MNFHYRNVYVRVKVLISLESQLALKTLFVLEFVLETRWYR